MRAAILQSAMDVDESSSEQKRASRNVFSTYLTYVCLRVIAMILYAPPFFFSYVLAVGNVAYDSTEQQLMDLFQTVGPVISMR